MIESDDFLSDDEDDDFLSGDGVIIDVQLEDDEEEEFGAISNPELIKFEELELLIDDEETDESFSFEEEDSSLEVLVDDEDQDAVIIDVNDKDEVNQLAVQEETSKSLVINSKARHDIGKSSFETITNENVQSYGAVSVSLRSHLISDKQLENQIMGDLLTDSLPFLNEKLQSQIKKRIDEVDDTIESTNQLFDSLAIDEIYDTEIQRQLFYKHVQKLRKTSFLTRREMRDSDIIRSKFSIEYTNELLGDQKPSLPIALPSLKHATPVLAKLLVLGRRSVTCTCGGCETVFHYKGDLITITRAPEINFVSTPLICPSCGKVNTLPKNILRNIRSKTREAVDKLKPLGNDVDVVVYVPKISDICDSIPELFAEEIKQSLSETSVSVDWEKYKKEFLTNVRTFYTLNKTEQSDSGIKVLAKILGNQSNDYVDLKEKAIATFIQFMKTSNLSCLSKLYIEELKVPMYYKDHFEEFYESLGDFLPMDSEDRSKKTIKETFDSYLDNIKTQEELREFYLAQLSSNAELFSNIPIISIKLNKEDIENFLSDEKLRRVIDVISDYMIVTNLAESFIEDFVPREIDPQKGISVKNKSFEVRFRNLKNINKSNKLRDNAENFLEYFNSFVKKVGQPKVTLDDFILCDESDYTIFEELSSICSLLRANDYYEAFKQRNELLNNHSDFFNSFSNSSRYSIIVNFLISFPKVNTDVDKFKFYFPEETTLTSEEQSKILNLIKIKKKIPAKLVGETFEEKYNYFNELDTYHNVKYWRNDDVYEFKTNSLVIIEAVSCMGITNYRDFLTYSVARDLLLSLTNLDSNTICKIFCLNRNVCNLYMNDDFKYTTYEFRKSKLFTSLIFKNKYLNNLVEEYNANPDVGISSFFADESLQMIDDLKGLEVPSKILNEAFTEEGI